jgi:hypothetical protein
MTESPDRFPWETDDEPLMGPAVPRGEDVPEDASLEEPLAPFLGGRDDAESQPEPAADEIPWLVPDGEELIGIDDLQSADLGAEIARATGEQAIEPAAESAPAAEPDEIDWAGSLDDLPGTDPISAEPAPEASARPAGDASHLAEDVARRLERIAQSLRTHGPAGILSPGADPLEALVVGYVLGHSHAGPGSRG